MEETSKCYNHVVRISFKIHNQPQQELLLQQLHFLLQPLLQHQHQHQLLLQVLLRLLLQLQSLNNQAPNSFRDQQGLYLMELLENLPTETVNVSDCY